MPYPFRESSAAPGSRPLASSPRRPSLASGEVLPCSELSQPGTFPKGPPAVSLPYAALSLWSHLKCLPQGPSLTPEPTVCPDTCGRGCDGPCPRVGVCGIHRRGAVSCFCVQHSKHSTFSVRLLSRGLALAAHGLLSPVQAQQTP